MKRGLGEEAAGPNQHKKHKRSNDNRYDRSGRGYDRREDYRQHDGRPQKHANSSRVSNNGLPTPKNDATYTEAFGKLPPSGSRSAEVPAYVPYTVPAVLPPLPSILSGNLTTSPFKHKSLTTYDRNTASPDSDITYERLEFLGDAYIELIASRLLFERYPTLTAGQQSQLRELLVKNETLAEFSIAYGFERRLEMAHKERMLEDAGKRNKGFTKVLGDVFEAYVAAVVLSDVEEGFAVAEKWLTTLWASKLLEHAPQAKGSALIESDGADPLEVYNPEAKAQLQKRILADSSVKISYEKYKDSVELKGAQLGQNRHFIAVFLTGYGYERKCLGQGEGRNKVEAGNWAAQKAMFGENGGIVDECEKQMLEVRERRRKEKAEREEAAAAAGAAT